MIKSTNGKLTVEKARENIVGIDTQVPLLNGSYRTYTNLDNAASTPVLRPVMDTVNDFMKWYSSIHRGTGYKSQVSTQIYDDAHEIACQFVNANPETTAVVFGKNATESLNKLARRFPFQPGDIVLTTMMEHHSNDLPWRTVAEVMHVNVTNLGALDEDHLDQLLKQYGERVKVVVVTGAANVTGYINPIHKIAEKVHRTGAKIVVDAAQLAPHRAIDIFSDKDPGHIDFLVTAAHKMYAPFGASCLFGSREFFLQGDPDFVGGGTVSIVTTENVHWAGLPDKEEAGSPNVVGAIAQAKTMLCLQEMGMDKLAEHEAVLTARLLTKLNKIDKIKVFGLNDPARAKERVGVVPFQIEGLSHYLVAAILSHEGAIGVRNGCFCAHPYLFRLLDLNHEESESYQQQILNNNRSLIPGLIRISFGCYNNEEDVDWVIDMLERITRGDYQGKYVQDPSNGEFWPEGYTPNIYQHFSL
ncbi:MAG: aminotransferase class V-fold PLP-dependent enzyme [Anaerolineaceae bacterium]|nr:aminotransferase class V-fold PLP-dependent enzyme [Anaerolineaceae bacterium]